MANTKEKIASMLAEMQFDRRPPVPKQKKAQFAALEADVGALLKDLNKLHLRLSHATSQRDYHSLSLEEARQTLEKAHSQLSDLLQCL
jgi:chromosome segregation ATPase